MDGHTLLWFCPRPEGMWPREPVVRLGWEPHLPPTPCCRLPAGSPLLVCIQRACELSGWVGGCVGGCVCVCFHLHGEEMWICKYSAPGIAFLKTLVSQGVQHVCWRKDQCLQEWGFSCGCGSQPPGFPGAATAATSATQGRQGHCRCVCVRCADPQRDEWLHTRQHLRVRFRVKLWTGWAHHLNKTVSSIRKER